MSVLPESTLERAVETLPEDRLMPARKAALERFRKRGFPSVREEDWKYTDLSKIADLSRRWLERGRTNGDETVPREQIERLTKDVDAHWLVIANGRISEEFLGRIALHGATVSRLSDDTVLPDFDRPLADLNAALLHDGLVIRIGASRQLDKPIGLLVIDAAAGEAAVSQVRIVIEAGENSRAAIFERHASTGDGEHYSNAVLELALAEGAAVDHVRLQERSFAHSQTARTAARLAAGSRLRHAAFDLGGRMTRNDLEIDLAGSGADAEFNGLYLAGSGQHIDNHTRVDHRVGPARSAQEYRGILSGRCRCVWNGKAIVHKGADGTDARQANHNLLLTERAEIDAKPELEIYADDVKASHGTTVGQLDEDSLFYLRSRGLSEADARAALTRAFAASVSENPPLASLGELLAAAVDARLEALTRRMEV